MASNPDLNVDWSGLEILSFEECLSLLGATHVGRLGFVDSGSPLILPINFAMDGSTAVFKTGEGSKLEAGMMQRPVCLEIDAWDSELHTGWSVLAMGIADEVLDETETARLDALDVGVWSRPDLPYYWVRVLIEEMSGRRIVSD